MKRDEILKSIEPPLVPAYFVIELMKISLVFLCKVAGFELEEEEK